MWVRTKGGRYYNLDEVTGLRIKSSDVREYAICAMINGKGYALAYYQTVKKAQEALDAMMDAYVDDCALYEMS